MGNSPPPSPKYSQQDSSPWSLYTGPKIYDASFNDPMELADKEDSKYKEVINKYDTMCNNISNVDINILNDVIHTCDHYVTLGIVAMEQTVKILAQKQAFGSIQEAKDFYESRIKVVNKMKDACVENAKLYEQKNQEILRAISKLPISKKGLQLLTEFEKKEETAYLDSELHLTIGVGHKILPQDGLKLYDKISELQINNFLYNDLVDTINGCYEIFGNKFNNLNETRQDILIIMCFQLGKGGLSRFKKFINAINKEDWSEAANEMIDSKWHTQTPNRCNRMADIMRRGYYN